MAIAVKLPVFIEKLQDAIASKFIGCEFEVEKLPGSNHYRLAVVWDGFAKSNVFKRQDRVWKIASRALTGDELLRISMILTLRPDELVEAGYSDGRRKKKKARLRH